MKYFRILLDTDEDLIGAYPQVNCLTVDYHDANASKFSNIEHWEKKSDIPKLDYFKTKYGALLIDVLTNSYVNLSDGLFLSEKCASIFSKFDLVQSNYYGAKIDFNGVIHEYFLLHYKSYIKNINFSKSIFWKINTITKEPHQKIDLNSYNQFKSIDLNLLKTSDDGLFPTLLSINTKFDLISLLGCTGDIIVSERLKNAIEEAKLTGFQFKDLDYEVVVE